MAPANQQVQVIRAQMPWDSREATRYLYVDSIIAKAAYTSEVMAVHNDHAHRSRVWGARLPAGQLCAPVSRIVTHRESANSIKAKSVMMADIHECHHLKFPANGPFAVDPIIRDDQAKVREKAKIVASARTPKAMKEEMSVVRIVY